MVPEDFQSGSGQEQGPKRTGRRSSRGSGHGRRGRGRGRGRGGPRPPKADQASAETASQGQPVAVEARELQSNVAETEPIESATASPALESEPQTELEAVRAEFEAEPLEQPQQDEPEPEAVQEETSQQDVDADFAKTSVPEPALPPEPVRAERRPQGQPWRSAQGSHAHQHQQPRSSQQQKAVTAVTQAIEQVNQIIQSLKEVMDDMDEVLETLELAERQKIVDEQEIESLKRALKSLQRTREHGASRHHD